MSDLKGKRAVVMGLGLFGGGVGAARYLVAQGAQVTVTDLRSKEDLATSVFALEGLPIRFRLGGHDSADFESADLVVANPAVPRTSPFLVAAESAGIPITTEICLFVARCPAKIIGVTGSSGKTTTTTLIWQMLSRVDRRSRVGGNLGRSLLEDLDRIEPDMPVILELSSFQLDRLGDLGWSPNLAVVTNFAPNHIDVHGSIDAYRIAKRNILINQIPGDWAVLNADDDEVSSWRSSAQRILFGLSGNRNVGVFLREGDITCAVNGEAQSICPVSSLRLPGRHNLSNAMAAVGAAVAKGVPRSDIAEVLGSFTGVPHRLEFIAEIDGVTYINDSIATSPDRTCVALASIQGNCILIAGGYDKKIPFALLGSAIAQKVQHLILMGQTAMPIANALPGETTTQVHFVSDISEAVSLASAVSCPGQTVLLSPASASYDQFLNFEARGNQFRKLVEALGGSRVGRS
jgi:UDP-N-acetylmuramoylalanine--D-glutamate ligase